MIGVQEDSKESKEQIPDKVTYQPEPPSSIKAKKRMKTLSLSLASLDNGGIWKTVKCVEHSQGAVTRTTLQLCPLCSVKKYG